MTKDKVEQISKSLIKELDKYEIYQLKILLGIYLNKEREKIVRGRW